MFVAVILLCVCFAVTVVADRDIDGASEFGTRAMLSAWLMLWYLSNALLVPVCLGGLW